MACAESPSCASSSVGSIFSSKTFAAVSAVSMTASAAERRSPTNHILRRLTLACTGSITRFSRNIRPHQRFVGGSSDQPPVSAMRPTSLWEELTRMRLAGRTSIVLRIRSLSTSSELPPAYPMKCLVAARVLTSVVLSPAARPAQSRKSSSCSSARARPHHRRRRGARRRLRREGRGLQARRRGRPHLLAGRGPAHARRGVRRLCRSHAASGRQAPCRASGVL